jgi:DNA-binding response OmpR family regulator
VTELAPPVVLVVDDEQSMRGVLERSLRLRGCVPLVAMSVREAALIAHATHVDAFIIDLNLARGHSGLDVLQWLRDQPAYRSAPIFVLTGQLDVSADSLQQIECHHARIFYKGQSLQPLIDDLLRMVDDARDS